MIIFFWFILSLIVASLGSNKSIGSVGAFFISLIFSPIIGLLVVLASSNKKKIINPKIRSLTLKANKLKKNDINSGLELMKEALSLNPNFSISNYNIACFYSLSKDKDNAFKHLEKAVEFGYTKFDSIKKDSDLNWLRNQSGYDEFVLNGYKKDKKSTALNYIDELKELANLRDNAIITTEEFEKQKIIILESRK